MSSGWHDFGCIKDKCNFWRQIQNTQFKGPRSGLNPMCTHRDGEVPSKKELSSYFEELLVVKFPVKRNLVPQMRNFSPTLCTQRVSCGSPPERGFRKVHNKGQSRLMYWHHQDVARLLIRIDWQLRVVIKGRVTSYLKVPQHQISRRLIEVQDIYQRIWYLVTAKCTPLYCSPERKTDPDVLLLP